MVKASGIKVQKPEKSMFRTNAICVLRHKSLGNTEFQGFFHGFGFGYSWVQLMLPR